MDVPSGASAISKTSQRTPFRPSAMAAESPAMPPPTIKAFSMMGMVRFVLNRSEWRLSRPSVHDARGILLTGRVRAGGLGRTALALSRHERFNRFSRSLCRDQLA